MMKTKYSENLVNLVGKMIFNTNKDGLSKYEDLITEVTIQIRENIGRLKDVYGGTKNSRPDSLQKIGRFSKSGTAVNVSRQQSSHSSISIPTLSYSSSSSFLPLQSQKPILSFQMLKRYYQKIQSRSQNVLVKQKIALLSELPLKNENQLQQLILQDEKRILNQLNKIQNTNITMNNRSKRFVHRKIQNGTPKKIINNETKHSSNKIDQSKQKEKRINSTTKLKQQKFNKIYQQILLGSVSCQTISQKDRIEKRLNQEEKQHEFNQKLMENNFKKQITSFQSSKTDLKNLIKSKNLHKNNLGQKDLQKNPNGPVKMNSENVDNIYMKKYEQLLQKQRGFF